jgi:hypothetical protein
MHTLAKLPHRSPRAMTTAYAAVDIAVSFRYRCVKKQSGLDTLDGAGPASDDVAAARTRRSRSAGAGPASDDVAAARTRRSRSARRGRSAISWARMWGPGRLAESSRDSSRNQNSSRLHLSRAAISSNVNDRQQHKRWWLADARSCAGQSCFGGAFGLIHLWRRPMSWADLLRRVFADDVLLCACGGPPQRRGLRRRCHPDRARLGRPA